MRIRPDTVHNNHLHDFGFWSWAVGGGLLCSEAISGYQQGYYVGTIEAFDILLPVGHMPDEFLKMNKDQGFIDGEVPDHELHVGAYLVMEINDAGGGGG